MRISYLSSDVCSSDLCDERVATGFRENFERQAPVALDDRDARNGLDCIEHRLLALLDRAEYPVHLGDARFRIFLDKGDDDVVLVIEQSIDLADADRRLGGELGCRRRVKSLRRSEEHTSELQSLMRNSSAVFCFKKKNNNQLT